LLAESRRLDCGWERRLEVAQPQKSLARELVYQYGYHSERQKKGKFEK